MNELLDLVWRYQFYWLPLVAGVAVGVCAVGTANMVIRHRRRRNQGDGNAKKQPEYDPFTQGSLTEQRRSYRREGNPVEIVYTEVDNKNYTHHGIVLDRSVGGIRLGLDQELASGTRIMILPANVTGVTLWTEVEVRSSTKVGDSWETGCQFIKSPPWSVLLLFG